MEVQTGRRVKKLRTNNGWEFVKREFEEFCQRKGIQRHKTVIYTPQQNGLAERMNKTILERVRCMLLVLIYLNVFREKLSIQQYT